jgi:hypothetical protein
MSLVGSLEDLGLGDILQIVHLAGKSGVLRLRNESGEGQIVFKRGMIHEAYAKGGPTDLRELLAGRRAVPGPLLERAWLEAHHAGRKLAEVLVERGLATGEAIDALRREQIESAVLAMFGWPSGEFSFEMRDVGDEGAELALEAGMNPQFLALEGTRRADERDHAQEPEPGGEPDPFAALLEAELVDEEGGDASGEPIAPLASAEPGAGREAPAPSAAVPVTPPPVVVIDPSLPALEWAKAAVGAAFPRVHVFQRPGLGIERIRQYLSRVELPLVLIAHDVPPDPATGARDAGEIVARLKRQAPGMTVLLLHDEGSEPKQMTRGPAPDGFAPRPPAALLVDPRAGRQRMRVASALQEVLERAQVRSPRPSERAASRRAPVEELAHLRETSARIREGAGRGEVLSQVLSFAAQRFARVALFGVREERVFGVAQAGLARAGGPDDAALRELSLGSAEPAWFRRVIESKRPASAPPGDEGDHRLAVLLGNEIPGEAWVAPIVTGERVVALLYCDNLPGREPIADTRSLEVLLDAAGIALDRAVLERTLADSEVADPDPR